jgi:hypothetical protein
VNFFLSFSFCPKNKLLILDQEGVMVTMTRRKNVKNIQLGVCGDMHACHHQCTVNEDQQALVMGLGTRDCVAGCGWGASSDEEEVLLLTVEDRELREKALEAECVAALKRWVAYGRDLDFTPYLKERVTKPAAGKTRCSLTHTTLDHLSVSLPFSTQLSMPIRSRLTLTTYSYRCSLSLAIEGKLLTVW